MNQLRKEIEEKRLVLRLIEKEEPDDYTEMTESEIIAAEKKRKPEPEEEEPERLFYSHTLDPFDHSYLHHNGRLHSLLRRRR